MIDHVAAAEKISDMSRANEANLKRAARLEKYLYTIYAMNEIYTAYNPEVATMLISYGDPRPNAKKNIYACVTQALGETPGYAVANSQQPRYRFSDGFWVVLRFDFSRKPSAPAGVKSK